MNPGFAVITFVLGYALGVFVGFGIKDGSAIKAGVAEYRLVDPATGKTEFTWLNGKEISK